LRKEFGVDCTMPATRRTKTVSSRRPILDEPVVATCGTTRKKSSSKRIAEDFA
jgi:hypothetical protein